jgi:hypothetical protein
MRVLAIASLTLALGCDTPHSAMSAPDLGSDPAAITASWSTFAAGVPLQKPRWGMPVVQVPAERRFIGFGGTLYPNGGAVAETWSLSMRDQSWSSIVDAIDPPPARYCHCLAYLPEQNEVLLVGGRNDEGPLAPAAWTLNIATGTWLAVSGPDLPPGVIGCHVAYLAGAGKAYVFGGGGAGGLSSDTHVYDPIARTFTRLQPAVHPPARMDGAAAFDPGDGGRMLVFGGAISVDPSHPKHLDDLWAFDGTAWTQLDPGARPPARRVPAAAFDPTHRAWMIFGGTIETDDLADLWRFDAAAGTFTQLSPTMGDGAPPARGFASAGYDPIEDGYVIVGGLDQVFLRGLSDGWLLHLR